MDFLIKILCRKYLVISVSVLYWSACATGTDFFVELTSVAKFKNQTFSNSEWTSAHCSIGRGPNRIALVCSPSLPDRVHAGCKRAIRRFLDVHEGFPRDTCVSVISTPRPFAPRFPADTSRPLAPDYLHFANGAFAGCSIPDPRPCTYRGGVGWLDSMRRTGKAAGTSSRFTSHTTRKTSDLAHAQALRRAQANQRPRRRK